MDMMVSKGLCDDEALAVCLHLSAMLYLRIIVKDYVV